VNSSPPLPGPMACPDGLTSRYEALRRQALGQPCAIPRGQGLALLMRSGMRAWMQAWAQCEVPLPARAKPSPANEDIFPLELHREVTMILAGMLLNGHQGATA
jgi:hypothetical protein